MCAKVSITMNRREIAKHYGVSEVTISNWEKEGMPVDRVVGIRKPRYDVEKVLKWLAKRGK